MTDSDKRLNEMLEVIESLCRYNGEISMYEDLVLRDIGYLLKSLQNMKIKEELLG